MKMLSTIFFSPFCITIKLLHCRTHVKIHKYCMSKLLKILSFTELWREENSILQELVKRRVIIVRVCMSAFSVKQDVGSLDATKLDES